LREARQCRAESAHRRLFGFATPERSLVLESVALESVLAGEPVNLPPIAPAPTTT